MQATVRSFDPAAGSGSVFLDDGTVVEFGPAAFAARACGCCGPASGWPSGVTTAAPSPA